MRLFSFIAVLLVLSGCTGSFIRLKAQNPQANDYASSLAAEYLSYSESEVEQGHLVIAEYYADKGLRALGGEVVVPEAPPTDEKSDLAKAHSALMALATEDMKRVAPQKAARAQLLYDCWNRQKATRADEEAPCADELRSTLIEMQMIADSFTYGEETRHTIEFARGSAKLGTAAREKVKEITRHGMCLAKYAIEIHVGVDKKTAALSQKRAQLLRSAFIAEGAPAESIRIITENTSKVVHLSSDEDMVSENALQVVMRSFTVL